MFYNVENIQNKGKPMNWLVCSCLLLVMYVCMYAYNYCVCVCMYVSDSAAGGAAVGLQEVELLSELCVFSHLQWVSVSTK